MNATKTNVKSIERIIVASRGRRLYFVEEHFVGKEDAL